jgi:hypothetical protein
MQHVTEHLPEVGLVPKARLSDGAGAQSGRCGRHAFELARALTQEVRTARPQFANHAHLFLSGPNTLSIFVGQH